MLVLEFCQVVSILVDQDPRAKMLDKVLVCIRVSIYQRSSLVLWLATSSLEKVLDIVREELKKCIV